MGLFAEYRPSEHGGPAPAGLSTRPARVSDLEALARLRVARGECTQAEALASFAKVLSRVEAGVALLLVAEADGRVLGYGSVEGTSPPGLPEGWYLGGLVVAEEARRRGIGRRLTVERLAWIAERAREAWYFVNARNGASIDLHAGYGFEEVRRDIVVPGVTFTGGVGVLFRAPLS